MQTETTERAAAAASPELVSKVTLPDESRLKREADAFVSMVESYVIDGPDTFQEAANDRNNIQDRWNTVEEQRKYLKEPSLEQGRRIDNFFKPVLNTLERARKALDGKIAAFTEAERQKNEADARKAREEAEREAQRKRELAAKEEAEAKAKAEALRKQADDAAAAGNAGKAAQLQERAANTEANGALKAHELTLAAEQTAAMPAPVPTATTKASGISMQYDYSAECFDTLALMTHIVAKRPDLVPLFEIKASALNGQAKSLKEALDLPGVKLVKKPRISDKR